MPSVAVMRDAEVQHVGNPAAFGSTLYNDVAGLIVPTDGELPNIIPQPPRIACSSTLDFTERCLVGFLSRAAKADPF